MTVTYGVAAATGVLEELRGHLPLTVAGAARCFAAKGWTPGRRSRSGDGVPTGWDRDGVQAWILPFGDGAIEVSFAVWIRDVDASGYFDDVDAVYEEGERVLAAVVPLIERSSLAGCLTPTGREATGEDEYIALRGWDLGGRALTAGAVQHDGDLPVMVVITLEQPA
ncbi:hypothetical protein [Streptomyces sp. NPDC056600]|uniref:hypothetical protein n=1 Tax=Streptomyces sp. NPDC056600 TaxID=3345874 RepID=UPI003693437B